MTLDEFYQQQADSVGLTVDQYKAAMATAAAPSGQATSYMSGGGSSNPSSGSGNQPTIGPGSSTYDILKVLNAVGATGGSSQKAPPAPVYADVNDPMNAASALGAAALNQKMIKNSQPGQGAMTKGGINTVQPATVSQDVPGVPAQYLSQPGVFAQAQTLAPTQGGPGSGTSTLTPTPQPTAASYSATPKPFAVAPPAPGATMQQPTMQPVQSAQTPTPFLAAHTSALANAGQALYAHYGGDPNTASPNDISNFHNQVMNAVSSGAQMAAPATGAVAPIKMARGGFVPGEGDEDSVLAALTPGEYVIPKAQIKKAIDNPPPEVRSPKAQPSAEVQSMPNSTSAATTVDAAGQVQPASSSSSSSPSLGSSDFSKMLEQAAQNQQANRDFAAMGTGGYSAPAGSSATTVGDVAGGAAIPNAGQTQSLGKVGPSAASGTASAIGGLASGLSAAAQAYADSIKPWQVQASAIPNPDDFKKQPTYTFQPVGT